MRQGVWKKVCEGGRECGGRCVRHSVWPKVTVCKEEERLKAEVGRKVCGRRASVYMSRQR